MKGESIRCSDDGLKALMVMGHWAVEVGGPTTAVRRRVWATSLAQSTTLGFDLFKRKRGILFYVCTGL